MAALMEGFSLAKIAGESSLIGVESGEQSNQVIITSKTGFINVYQLSDQKLINSWSLRHGIQITCPTVWCKNKEKFLAVQNKQQLKLWTSETPNFDKAKKKHIGADIHQVLVQDDFPPILVCQDGRVNFQESLQEGGTMSAAEGGREVDGVLWCQSFIAAGSLTVVVLTSSKDKKMILWRHTYLSDAECWRQQTWELSRNADTMLGCCLSKKWEPTLLTLWKTGPLQETSLSSVLREVDEHEVAVIPGVQRKCSIISLDHTHIAIAGIERDGKSGLGIYNVKFEAMQTWIPYPESVFTNPNLYCHYEHLFLACNKTLYAFPYHCQPSTVATLLGQQLKGREVVTDIPPGSISWAEGSTTQKSGNDSEIEELFSSLNDKTKQKQPTTEFVRVFEKLMKLLQLPMNRHWLSSRHVSLLSRACLSRSEPWPRAQLTQLIEHRLLAHSEQSGLFEALISHKEVSLLHQMLTTLPDISELSLVQCVQCYLDLTDDEFVQACSDVSITSPISETPDDPPLPVCPAKAALLNHVLGLPFNHVFLVDCLRKLSFKNVLILMEHLYHLLKQLPITCTGDGGSNSTPSVGKVTDWLSLLIDAHVTQLIISPDARMLLGNLHEIISEQVEFYNQLSTLEAVLTQLKRKCSPVTQQKVGTYCIEVLHVR